MASTSGRASATNTALPMEIRLPAGSPVIGSRQISTPVTSTLSSAQPVTGIAPMTPVVLFAGVSKLPNGFPELTLVTFTWICCGEFAAPDAVTVTTPLDPAAAPICSVAFPRPDAGDTVIFDLLEEADQLTPLPPVN